MICVEMDLNIMELRVRIADKNEPHVGGCVRMGKVVFRCRDLP